MINMVVCIDLKERVLDIGLKIWILSGLFDQSLRSMHQGTGLNGKGMYYVPHTSTITLRVLCTECNTIAHGSLL
jgi:hypothetical protein